MPPSPSFCRDVAEGLGDGDLLLVADLQAAEEDHSALLQRRADVLRFASTQQGVEVGSDLAADSRGEVDDFELCGGESHGFSSLS